MTLESFGESTGVAVSTLNAWEHGARNVPESKLRLICTVFNVSREWLETGKGEMFVASKTPADLDFEAFKRVARRFLDALSPEMRKAALELAREFAEAEGAAETNKASAKKRGKGREE